MCVCLCKTVMGKHRVGFKGKQNLLLWDEYADVEHAMDYVNISLSGANTCVTEWHLSIMNILSSQAQQLSGGRIDFSSQPGLQSILQKSSRNSASHTANTVKGREEQTDLCCLPASSCALFFTYTVQAPVK